jgi:hypothetical protein
MGIAIPPSVIITRWSSWLRAAIYYSDNLPTIYNIFKNIKPEGILYQRAYEALHNPTVYPNLITIKRSYSFLINILDMFENEGLTINTGYEEVDKIKIQEDPVELMHYVQACIEKNDIKSITLIRNTLISPSDYCFLQDCPPTSITVERSFSMLKKLLAVDRNFNKENIIKYFMVYFNVSASNDKQLENIEEFSDNQIE